MLKEPLFYLRLLIYFIISKHFPAKRDAIQIFIYLFNSFSPHRGLHFEKFFCIVTYIQISRAYVQKFLLYVDMRVSLYK